MNRLKHENRQAFAESFLQNRQAFADSFVPGLTPTAHQTSPQPWEPPREAVLDDRERAALGLSLDSDFARRKTSGAQSNQILYQNCFR